MLLGACSCFGADSIFKAPLLLPLFALLPDSRRFPVIATIFFSLVDVLNADALVTISDSAQSVAGRLHSTPRKSIKWGGPAIAAWYVSSLICIDPCKGRV